MSQSGKVFTFRRRREQSLEQILTMEAGRRVGALPGHSNSSPRTVFDIERDAEVAEIHRMFDAYKAHQQKVFRLFASASLIACIGAALLGAYVSHVGSSANAPQLATQPAVAVAKNQVVATPPEPVASTSVAAIVAVGPVETASSPAKESTEQTQPSKAANDGPLPPDLRPIGRPTPAVADTKLGAPQSGKHKTPAESDQKRQTPIEVAKKDASKKEIDAPQGAQKEERIFALESTSQDRKPTMVEQPVEAAIKPSPAITRNKPVEEAKNTGKTESKTDHTSVSKASSNSSNLRTEQFGSSGIVTLTPGGVVVYDRQQKVHRMIKIGEAFADGSVVKGVDVQKNRVTTDKGEIQME